MTAFPLKRVVYVDDEPHIRLLAETCLTRVGGLETTTFDSGVSFLAAASELTPQMVLLDVMMPELDGPATLEKMRAIPHLADVPVVFVTAKNRASETDRLKQLGALEVIAKPFRPMTISQDLQELWTRHCAARKEVEPPSS
ncbi:response regulator [Lichenihabitans sp. Uapishka_5]|uniref:response regulator n=1 Tax=Lichenihabitans sp. Uapishka_5 TaxID=3037302 RepID=UPI0029E7CC08|nr:response regulator [Lichenihabitans sp. Uapishka_5]MDX7950861.1 response regulator [Lichenihabitans sp. Uapishka_5]